MAFNYPSEVSLELEPVWFRGRDWANGTAQRECRRQFLQAVHDYYARRIKEEKRQVKRDMRDVSLLDLRKMVGALRKKYQ